MKKRIVSFLLTLAMLLSVVSAYADTTEAAPTITVGEQTITQGASTTVSITASDFSGVGSVDFTIYYDSEALHLSSNAAGNLIDGSNSFISVNADKPGIVRVSSVAMDGYAASGTLLRLTFTTSDGCAAGTYPLLVTVGDAYSVGHTAVKINGTKGQITVEEKEITIKPFGMYNYINSSTLRKGDTLTLHLANSGYYSSNNYFASADFTVSYDSNIFAVESVELDENLKIEGAFYSINTKVKGNVRVSYASDTTVKSFYLMQVNLKVIADTEGATTLTYGASNVYREDLTAYAPFTGTTKVTLQKLPEVTDYPNLWLDSSRKVVGQQATSTLKLEQGAGVAAGDFTITYDPAVLRCVNVTVAEGLGDMGGMIIVDDNFADGTIELPYVNSQGYAATDVPLINIVWEVLDSPETHYQTTLSGEMVANTNFKNVTLEYVTDTGCIYAPSGTAPEGDPLSTLYICNCCGESIALPRKATGITISALPEKLTYLGNLEALDVTGGEVSLSYDNGVSEATAMTAAMVTGFDNTVVGQQTLTVQWQGYSAEFAVEIVKAVVEFHDWDGTVISSEEYMGGDTVAVPTDPTRAADETYTYDFAGWDKTVTKVTGDATYTATYTPTYIEYTVVFKNWDGVELSREKYHYGDTVVVPKNPTKAANKVYAYAFAGWSTEMEGSVTQYPVGTEIPTVEGEVTYNAYFTKTVVGLRGDVNDDGRVTVSDVARTNAYVKGVMTLTAEELLVADVNADGQVDDDDILHLSNEILGKGHVYEQGACTICGSVL